MDFNGYKRTKKFDIKRWFKGTNSIVYLVILVVMVLGLLFVLRTVISMHNSNKNSDNVSQEETTGETDSSEKDTQTQTIAKNQSYYIRISIVKHTLVVYQLDDNKEFSIPVKAFKVALGPKVAPAKTAISEKSLWRKITDIYYVRLLFKDLIMLSILVRQLITVRVIIILIQSHTMLLDRMYQTVLFL